MYNNTTRPATIEELEAFALEIPRQGMHGYYPQFGNESFVYFPSGEDRHWYNNGVCSWVRLGSYFVCPYFKEIGPILGHELEKAPLHVPFSNWDHPDKIKARDAYAKWQSLRAVTDEWFDEDERAEVRSRVNVGNAPESVLSRCFEIPKKGIEVQSPHAENTYLVFPMWKGVIDCTFSDVLPFLGKYYTNNGTLQVNTNDGRTFVCRGYDQEMVSALRDAGYQQERFFVNFSNGEQIISA